MSTSAIANSETQRPSRTATTQQRPPQSDPTPHPSAPTTSERSEPPRLVLPAAVLTAHEPYTASRRPHRLAPNPPSSTSLHSPLTLTPTPSTPQPADSVTTQQLHVLRCQPPTCCHPFHHRQPEPACHPNLLAAPPATSHSNPNSSPPCPPPRSPPRPLSIPSRDVHTVALNHELDIHKRFKILKDKLQELGFNYDNYVPGQCNNQMCPKCQGGDAKEKKLVYLHQRRWKGNPVEMFQRQVWLEWC